MGICLSGGCRNKSEPLVKALVVRLGPRRKRMAIPTLTLSSHKTLSMPSLKFQDSIRFTFMCRQHRVGRKIILHTSYWKQLNITPGVKTWYPLVMMKIVTRTGNGTAQIRFNDNDLMNVKGIGNGTSVTIPSPPWNGNVPDLVTCPTYGPDYSAKEIRRLAATLGWGMGGQNSPQVSACPCEHMSLLLWTLLHLGISHCWFFSFGLNKAGQTWKNNER